MGRKKKLVGKVVLYLPKQEIAMVDVADDFRLGDEILIEGTETQLRQKVSFMNMKAEDTIYVPIKVARAGNIIGLKVNGKVRRGDLVYKY